MVVTPSAGSSHSVTRSSGFIAGVSVGGVVGLCLLLMGLYFWRKRGQSQQYDTAASGNGDTGNVEPSSNAAPYGMTATPQPNPYSQPFPLNQPHSDVGGPADSLVPDQHRGYSSPQPNLQYSPALNPYNVSQAAATTGLGFGGHERPPNRSPAPSYRTEDPAVQGQTPRSRRPLDGRDPEMQ